MKSKKGAFVRTPVKDKITKDKELSDFLTGEPYDILCSEIKKGSAIMLLGSENSPIPEYSKAIRLEMRKPTGNGIVCYDAYVAFKPQWKRPVITVSLFDYGNQIIVHSIKRLGPIRSKTLYAADMEVNNDAVT